ncbi:MAG: hypothetical protein ACFCUE_12520 [Candidatus Bathyarchaeia archaeon]|jgi:DNA-directed RNA polymerase subunit RPC12/RpoP
MDSNLLIAGVYAAFWIAPVILAIAGAKAYDHFQKHKSRVGDKYRCRRCGLVFLAKNAQVSGFINHRYGLHIHCSRCGAVVEQFVKLKTGQATPTYLYPNIQSMQKT